MGVGAGLYMCDVVKKFTFAISSPDEFLSHLRRNGRCAYMWQFTPRRPGARPISDAERIHTEVEDQLTNCQCHSQFSAVRVDDGKYKVQRLWILHVLLFVFCFHKCDIIELASSTGTVHTSAKAGLTSVAIRIRIHIRIRSPPKFNLLFYGALPTFPENFIQIRLEVFTQSC